MSEGGCYCGAVRYSVGGPAMFKGQCHCRECQYITGGGPNVFMVVGPPSFSYTKGAPKTFTRADIPNPVTREFCPDCGTHMTTRAQGGAMVIVKVGTLDEPAAAYGMPQAAIFLCDKQPFHVVPEGVAQFDKMPG
jgi:hypothetical protein